MTYIGDPLMDRKEKVFTVFSVFIAVPAAHIIIKI